MLFTGSLRDAFATGETAEPVAVGGEEPSIDRWRFVPETSSLLLNDFSSNLTLLDTVDESATTFGQAGGIQGVARSTYTALIWRVEEGFTELDLSSGEEVPVDDVDLGGETILGHMIPLATGGTLRGYAEMVEGTPADSRIVAAADGSVTDVAIAERAVCRRDRRARHRAQRFRSRRSAVAARRRDARARHTHGRTRGHCPRVRLELV